VPKKEKRQRIHQEPNAQTHPLKNAAHNAQAAAATSSDSRQQNHSALTSADWSK
jgi:hypothetical protein